MISKQSFDVGKYLENCLIKVSRLLENNLLLQLRLRKYFSIWYYCSWMCLVALFSMKS